MDKTVTVIPAEQVQKRQGRTANRLRVAAYCRVSTEEERQLGSFENQIEYFTRLIGQNAGYELVKVYSDEGITGTNTRRRGGFRSMIADCEAGQIDLIVTKSISRFARNTQDSLNYTRKLRDMGIGVCFEKEGINTLESSGELLLTLFSCFAQEESRSISENTAWGIRSRFQQGIPHLNAEILMGYDKNRAGELVVNEAQAAVVRRVYRSFLEGFSLNAIARALNEDGIPGVRGEVKWCATTIRRMLENEKYKGDLLMQKTLTANYLTHQCVRNVGQLNQYYVAGNHEAIIPPAEWEAVREELARRREFVRRHGIRGMSGVHDSPFYARVFCERCELKLVRFFRTGDKYPRWSCKSCGLTIPERELRERFRDAFNAIAESRESRLPAWEAAQSAPSALRRYRAEQMRLITEDGPIPHELPELTRAVLEEAWAGQEGTLRFRFLSGDCWPP